MGVKETSQRDREHQQERGSGWSLGRIKCTESQRQKIEGPQNPGWSVGMGWGTRVMAWKERV